MAEQAFLMLLKLVDDLGDHLATMRNNQGIAKMYKINIGSLIGFLNFVLVGILSAWRDVSFTNVSVCVYCYRLQSMQTQEHTALL